ncbi:MAG TPA: 30S ribosomal protein S10 [archaeon]|nr:30S ribosomal protein S10 [archaeon]
MQKARIKLSSPDPLKLDSVCNELKDISEKFGIVMRGPIPLPTKKLKVTTMKTPCGDGTGHGNASWDRWEMRIHKRIVDISANERALRQITRVQIPDGVHISISLKEDKTSA